MSDDNILYDCEYVKSIADEYVHGELSETEKESVERHIAECGECRAFYDEERKLTDIIKAAAYSPETSVANLLMEKIIDEKIIIQKPRRNRPVPFGMISAAAIIVIMVAMSRTPIGDILGIFMAKGSNPISDNAADESAAGQTAISENDGIVIAENALIMPYYDGDNAENEEAAEAGTDMGYAQRGGVEDTDSVQFSFFDSNSNNSDDYSNIQTAPAEEAAYEYEAEAAPAPVEASPVVEAPAAVEGIQSPFSISEKMMRDIPIPTGEFCEERQAAVIICVSVFDDVKEKIVEIILTEIEKTDISATDSNVIRMGKKYYDAVIDIFSINGVEYEIREGTADAEEIAVFFY